MKIDRLISELLLLLERKRVTARELADRFEVSLRTVYRDIDAIGMSGIPVTATSGAGGGFEIMENYKIDANVFSTADLSAILTGLTGLSGMIRGDELANALAKVRSFIPPERAKDIELTASQIVIDLSPWMHNRNVQPYLETVKAALRESRLLSFDYVDRYGHTTARAAEPYRLVLKGNHWYWHGYCLERQDFRLFRLSRTSNLRISDRTFEPRAYSGPQLDFADAFRSMRTTITLRIHEALRDRVLDYCPFENFRSDGDDHWIVAFPFVENDYHYGILLGFGDRCECLGPPRVRGEMKRRIDDVAALYGS